MLGVGAFFPQFSLTGVKSIEDDNAFATITHDLNPGKWKLYFFWPKDFTFICPTELVGFSNLTGEFAKRDCVIYGASTDSEYVHLAWRQNNSALSDLKFVMISDIKHELCHGLGILDPKEGVAQRATFLVDPENKIRFAYVTDLDVGRNPQEVLRVLDALQTGERCPCGWNKGDATI
jgi:peroxiredoxin (alkyl hydroperoxide reductase subunit C)